jgi:hypothetical protein
MTTLSARGKDTKIDIGTNDDLQAHKDLKKYELTWEHLKTIIYIVGNVARFVISL